VDHLLFRFTRCQSVLEIFAIKSKVVEIAPNFWTLLPFQNIYGCKPPRNLYQNCHACPAARHVEKVRAVTALSNKVIGAHTPKFKFIFEFIVVKNCWGPPSQ